jgi:hypothetical protein
MWQLRLTYGCLAVLAGPFACGRQEPRSPIVEKVEQAGLGSLATVSKDSMRVCLGQHKDIAHQVDEMCKPVRQKATVQWSESTAGRLCAAARALAFWRGGPVTSDVGAYSPGLK